MSASEAARDRLPARALLEANDLARRIDRLAAAYEPVRLGTVAGARLVAATSTHSFGVYATGGDTLSTLGVPGVATVRMMPWTNGAGAIYFFLWDGTKMLVTDWTGTEIANGTDLSAIANWPYDVLGAASGRLAPWRSVGAGRVTSVGFDVATALSAASNYWTLTLRLMEANPLSPQTVGLKLGEFSTQYRGVAAGTLISLFSATDAGLLVKPGDRLFLDAVKTGNPAALEELTLWPLVQRSVR